MKKLMTLIALLTLVAISAQAKNYETVDMENHGTTYTATNSQSFGETLYESAAITYDAACTNTINFYSKVGGVLYKVGTSTVSNGMYDYITLNPMGIRSGDAQVITTTITNVTIRFVK
jgi:hypothetical protein